jgi:hypothetical protein
MKNTNINKLNKTLISFAYLIEKYLGKQDVKLWTGQDRVHFRALGGMLRIVCFH